MGILITGTGSYIPEQRVLNSTFASHEFYAEDGTRISSPPEEVIDKFKAITGIEERRYVNEDQQSSDIATIAARRAIEDAGIDPEQLDSIILAHNFGNIPHGSIQSDMVPSLASRVKHDLGIKNPDCTAYDVLYGCPGWIQGVIIARQFLLSGDASRILVIGSETLSRVIDPFDRDSMIYADGAGASVIENVPSEKISGIISVVSQTYANDEAYYLHYDESYKKGSEPGTRYIKMYGRKIYEFALNRVPLAMKACLDKSGLGIADVNKILIHQANEKMDEAIVQRLFKLYGIKDVPEGIMPMSINLLGNSSVATVPTLYNMISKGKLAGHQLSKGDVILMASVGAGMNINAITYRI